MERRTEARLRGRLPRGGRPRFGAMSRGEQHKHRQAKQEGHEQQDLRIVPRSAAGRRGRSAGGEPDPDRPVQRLRDLVDLLLQSARSSALRSSGRAPSLGRPALSQFSAKP
jgi:hypothetical protein